MESVERRALERAVQIVGSPESLARILDESSDRIEYWLEGLLPIPSDAFTKIVDVLLSENLAETGRECAKARAIVSKDETKNV